MHSVQRNSALRRAVAWLSVALFFSVTRASALQGPEIEVTRAPILDFEFADDRFAWISSAKELWVGHVDAQTGDFIPPNGKAELVDVDAVVPGNGPEWAASPNGHRLVYTKEPHTFFRLAQATFDGVSWQSQLLPFGSRHVVYGVDHLLPIGNPEPVGPLTPILSLRQSGNPAQTQLEWRLLDTPGPEKVVPHSLGATGGRWLNGELGIAFTAPVAGGREAYFYDAGAGVTEQLTFDGALNQTAFMWEAPEFLGERIFLTSVKGATMSQLRVYRSLDPDGDGLFAWTIIKTFNPPTKGIYFWSPEPFVHNGKSYIFWVASNNPDQPDPAFPSQVWIGAADPADPLYTSLSDATLGRFRMDPEVYVTGQGPFLYYNRFIPGTPQSYEGVFRVDTGLGPAQ